MALLQIDGVVPIVPTPFTHDGALDWSGLRDLIAFAIASRFCAVCLPAYASEFYKLSDDERRELPIRAIEMTSGSLPVIAQINHVSSTYVTDTARTLERAGASAISVAVPRFFGLPECDLLRYFDRILNAITVPLLIQDFNPGGPTVSVDFIRTLHRQYKHFRFLKLEEPLMSYRVRSILDATDGAIGVLEGWGGMYMLELIPAGICGVMPGLAVSDLLQLTWEEAKSGDIEEAYKLFRNVLPQIVYSLQSLEFFHHAEKSLLVARGLLHEANVRDATVTIQNDDLAHLAFLNRQIVSVVQDTTSAARNTR